jgi:flagellar assembly factor FliW
MAQVMANMGDNHTIRVVTSRFGELELDRQKVIAMTSPFLGFPDSKRFFLRPHSAESPFMWFQSLDDPNLAFVVIQSQILIPQYQPGIPENIRGELDTDPEAALDILLILTIPKNNPQGMTANLLGPLVINSAKRLAKQVLLDPTIYAPCWPVFTEDNR